MHGFARRQVEARPPAVSCPRRCRDRGTCSGLPAQGSEARSEARTRSCPEQAGRRDASLDDMKRYSADRGRLGRGRLGSLSIGRRIRAHLTQTPQRVAHGFGERSADGRARRT